MGEWRGWLVARGQPASTIKLRTWQLRRFLELVPAWQVADVDQLVAYLGGQGWSRETMRSHRAALRGFYGWARVTGRVQESPAELLPPIAPVAGVPRPAPDAVVRVSLDHPDQRTRLMMHLGARAGLRRGEIARVHESDLVEDLVGWSLVVRGKGGRERVVPIPDDVAFLLRRRADDLGGGWVFPGQDAGHLSPARVGELVSDALPRPWTSHSLRHYFATRSWQHTRDLLVVQRLLGHAKPETTQRYISLGADVLRAGVAWAA